MAVDTRNKRFSMMGLASPIVRLMQNPTGAIGALARAMLEFLYAAGAPASQPRTINLISRADNSLTLLTRVDTAPVFRSRADAALTLLSRADNALALRSSTV